MIGVDSRQFQIKFFRRWLKTSLRNIRLTLANTSREELRQITLRKCTRRSMQPFVLILCKRRPRSSNLRSTRGKSWPRCLILYEMLLKSWIMWWNRSFNSYRNLHFQIQSQEVDLRGEEGEVDWEVKCSECCCWKRRRWWRGRGWRVNYVVCYPFLSIFVTCFVLMELPLMAF